jgi:hypothetical protein
VALTRRSKIVSVKSFDPPSFDGWQVWCVTCSAPQEVDTIKERDMGTGEVYYD